MRRAVPFGSDPPIVSEGRDGVRVPAHRTVAEGAAIEDAWGLSHAGCTRDRKAVGGLPYRDAGPLQERTQPRPPCLAA